MNLALVQNLCVSYTFTGLAYRILCCWQSGSVKNKQTFFLLVVDGLSTSKKNWNRSYGKWALVFLSNCFAAEGTYIAMDGGE